MRDPGGSGGPGDPGGSGGSDQSTTARRKAARVLLVDESGAVLLLSGHDPDASSAPPFWFTPGGGAEPGETLVDAARREVLEETGHVIGDLGRVRWRRQTSFTFGGFQFDQDESYFVVRTPRFEARPLAWTELERRSVTGWRWWPLDELSTTDAVVHPPQLARLLGAIEKGGDFPGAARRAAPDHGGAGATLPSEGVARPKWTAPVPDRRDPDRVSVEPAALEQWVDYHRATLLTKCAGLTAEQLKRRSVPPSTLSLLGIVRHMANVERWWFRMHAAQEDLPLLFTVEQGDRSTADFDELDDADARADLEVYGREVDAARAAVAGKSLDLVVASRGDHPERTRDLRWIYLHMLEEYARHNGHADLLREAVDGATGD